MSTSDNNQLVIDEAFLADVPYVPPPTDPIERLGYIAEMIMNVTQSEDEDMAPYLSEVLEGLNDQMAAASQEAAQMNSNGDHYMQHFNGTLEGSANQVSRGGTKNSGVQATVQGSAALDVSLQYHEDDDGNDVDLFYISIRGNTRMSNCMPRKDIARIEYNRRTGALSVRHILTNEEFECDPGLARKVMQGTLNEVPLIEETETR